MSKYRLRGYDTMPHGGYCFPGFRSVPLIEGLAQQVAARRKANGEPRASYPEALADVDQYQCQRLGYNPAFCIPVQEEQPNIVSVASNAPGMTGGCRGCGAPVTP